MPTKTIKTAGNITNNNDDILVDGDGYVYISCDAEQATTIRLTGDSETYKVEATLTNNSSVDAEWEEVMAASTTDSPAAEFDVRKYNKMRLHLPTHTGKNIKVHWQHNRTNKAPLGIAALPKKLTINSTTVAPTYWYEGRDATLTNWAARAGIGGVLNVEGSGGSVGIKPATAGTKDRAVDTSTTRRWQSAVDINIGTDDFVVEAVAAFPSEAGYAVLCATRPDEGIALLKDTASTRMTFWAQGDTLAAINGATGLTAGSYYHIMVFFDASGSGQMYINGAASGSAVSVTAVNSIDGETNFQIGAYGSDLLPFNEEIALVALWKSPSWLNTHLQPGIASARSAIVGISN